MILSHFFLDLRLIYFPDEGGRLIGSSALVGNLGTTLRASPFNTHSVCSLDDFSGTSEYVRETADDPFQRGVETAASCVGKQRPDDIESVGVT